MGNPICINMLKALTQQFVLCLRNLSRRSNISIYRSLKEAVLRIIDYRLETLIQENLLVFLGFDELYEILDRKTLCVRSQKCLFDAIVNWIDSKRCLDSSDDEELALKLIEKAASTLSSLSENYVRDQTTTRLALPDANCISAADSGLNHRQKVLIFWEILHFFKELLGTC
jgi:hypothetical protein